MAEIGSPGLSLADVAALMPQPASALPRSETTIGSIGSIPMRYALEDHQHGRLTSTAYASVTSGNTATVLFTRTFVNKPGLVCFEENAPTVIGGQPALFGLASWVQGADNLYIGAVIRVWRSQTVPQNLATLLLSAVFNLFSASVVGTSFSCIAVARSDVAAT